MAHDDDADGFLGMIDIPHASSQKLSSSEKRPSSEDELVNPTPTHTGDDDSQLAELEKKITELEAEMAETLDAEHTLIEKITHLEKELSGGKTAGERYLRIAEDS